jgi:hypothetical protein
MFIIISRREEENTKYNQKIAQKMANKPPIHPLALVALNLKSSRLCPPILSISSFIIS